MDNEPTVDAPGPSPNRRSAGRFEWKALGKIMMLIGVMTTVLITAACGFVMYSMQRMGSDLPMLDGPGHDGTSAETAIVVRAANESDGVSLEYLWIDTNLPGTVLDQSLTFEGDRVYDVLMVDPVVGEQREVWFDITDWYGVW